MIKWLETQRYDDALWDYVIAVCRSIWDRLPGVEYRRVVEHFEQMGRCSIDDALAEAVAALERLERRMAKCGDPERFEELNSAIGFGRMVLAFDCQAASEAADSITEDLLDWSEDIGVAKEMLADILRLLVPDPTLPNPDMEAGQIWSNPKIRRLCLT